MTEQVLCRVHKMSEKHHWDTDVRKESEFLGQIYLVFWTIRSLLLEMSSVGSGLSIFWRQSQNKSQYIALEDSKLLWIVFYQRMQVGVTSTKNQVKSLSVFGKKDKTEREA